MTSPGSRAPQSCNGASSTHCRRAKRPQTGLVGPLPALSGSSPSDNSSRDWASLTAVGPAGQIAERVLSNDYVDFLRFRAACRAIMLLRAFIVYGWRRFLNVHTGECIHHAAIPDLRRCYLLGHTFERLLVLCQKGTHVVQLLNPLTGHLTDFPSATTLLPPCITWFSSGGIADDSTVALVCQDHAFLAVAKPGDERWTWLKPSGKVISVLPVVGRLYCLTCNNISVVETAANQKPRLVVVVNLGLQWSLYPVYNDGDLILVHHYPADSRCPCERHMMYKVKLDTGSVVPMGGLGGQALFINGDRSLSVPATVSSSIAADTIYVCKYDSHDDQLELLASRDMASSARRNWVPDTNRRQATKRARTQWPVRSNCHVQERDWANLTAGPAGLIAALVLSGDLGDYLRFRAVCAAWRASSDDPRAHGVFDRRFHPRRWAWIMLPHAFTIHRRRPFLNVPTGESIHVGLPDLRRHYIFGPTAEGLVVLCRKDTLVAQLLNPLTGQRADLPRATTLLKPGAACVAWTLKDFRVVAAGLTGDDSTTVALHHGDSSIAVAKPGDHRWTQLKPHDRFQSAMSFAGRFYCVTSKNILAVETRANQQPQLVPAVDYHPDISWVPSSEVVHLVDNNGELICVHCIWEPEKPYIWKQFSYRTYRVNLGTGSMEPMRGLDGHALFIGMGRSILVPARVSPSISADSIYTCYDYNKRTGRSDVRAIGILGSSFRPNFDKADIANYLSSYVCS
ncbi:hypothetical protein ACP70R_005523 [Stipagrostis hirtigluma subsp. patula]